MNVADIQFGKAVSVEVECYGVVAQNPAEYVAKRDGSLRMGGVEVVVTTAKVEGQPISIPALDAVNHCTVDRTCGLHVHVDVRDLMTAEAARVYKQILRASNALKMLVPDSRIGNRYCAWRSNHSPRAGRYSAINFKAYHKFRTIEFRCQSGSTERTKIENWAELCYQLVQWARTSTGTGQLSWNRFLNIFTTETKRYAILRRTKLRHRELRPMVIAALAGGDAQGMVAELVGRRVQAPRREMAAATTRRSSQRWNGYSLSSVLRGMGALGLSESTAMNLVNRDGINVIPSTVRFMVRQGRRNEGTMAPASVVRSIAGIGAALAAPSV